MSKKRNKVRLVELTAIREPEHYLESPVRFSLLHCHFGGAYCIKNLERKELGRLYKTLGHFEKYTWKQFQSLPREKGWTPEIEDSSSFAMIKNMYPILEHFGHLRVDGTDSGLFRIFAARASNLIYILLFDNKGAIHH